MMQQFQNGNYRNASLVYEEEELGSIQIIIPPKPGEEDTYCAANPETLDVCSLSMSSLGKETDLPASKLPFTWKLFEMLEDVHRQGRSDVVSWVDGGRAFKVHDLRVFVDEIIPIYFKQSKYKSFQRQLYFYGFTRVAKGPEAGAYYHPKFLEGRKKLCLSMTPKKNKCREAREELKRKVIQEQAAPPGTTQIDAPPIPQKQAPRRVSADTVIDVIAEVSDVSENEQNQTEHEKSEHQEEPAWMKKIADVIKSGTPGWSSTAPASLPRVSFSTHESYSAHEPEGPSWYGYQKSFPKYYRDQPPGRHAEPQIIANDYREVRTLQQDDDFDIFGDMPFHLVDTTFPF
jgi:hypothetical protein